MVTKTYANKRDGYRFERLPMTDEEAYQNRTRRA